jgi:hypothetical protein
MATTTPNFGWPVPTSTDLVKDGAVAIEGLGDAIDASLLDLKGGTTNQVLAKNSNTDMDFKWVADASGIPATIIDAKGDLIAGTAADTAARLAVGTNGQVLTADSTAATGLAWATAAGASGPAFNAYRSGSQQSFSQNTWTKVQFNSEYFDTDTCYDSSTNYRFTANKAGYYQFTAGLYINRTGSYAAYGSFYKNGSEIAKILGNTNMAGTSYQGGNGFLTYMNGTTDYMEVYIYDSDPAARNVGDTPSNFFSAIWIRS